MYIYTQRTYINNNIFTHTPLYPASQYRYRVQRWYTLQSNPEKGKRIKKAICREMMKKKREKKASPVGGWNDDKGDGKGTRTQRAGKENRLQAIFRRNFHWMDAILSVKGSEVVRSMAIGCCQGNASPLAPIPARAPLFTGDETPVVVGGRFAPIHIPPANPPSQQDNCISRTESRKNSRRAVPLRCLSL